MRPLGAPAIKRFFALSQEFVPLVNGRYTGNRARLVVENFIGDMRPSRIGLQPSAPGNLSDDAISGAPISLDRICSNLLLNADELRNADALTDVAEEVSTKSKSESKVRVPSVSTGNFTAAHAQIGRFAHGRHGSF